jgi:hypothetical protein
MHKKRPENLVHAAPSMAIIDLRICKNTKPNTIEAVDGRESASELGNCWCDRGPSSATRLWQLGSNARPECNQQLVVGTGNRTQNVKKIYRNADPLPFDPFVTKSQWSSEFSRLETSSAEFRLMRGIEGSLK